MELDLEGKSIEELEALEDKLAAEEVESETEKPSEEIVTDGKPEIAVEPDKAEEVAEKVTEPTPELVEHVSPPKKWIEQRRKRNEEPGEEKTTVEESPLQSDFDELKEKHDALVSLVGEHGIKPNDPLSSEKLKALREDYDDELIDALEALIIKPVAAKEVLKVKEPKTLTQETVVNTQQVDSENAINENDDLSYWREAKPELWDRAVKASDTLFDEDKTYNPDSYDDHFKNVVERVKKDYFEEAKQTGKPLEDDKKGVLPDSLSGADGSVPAPDQKSIVDKITALPADQQYEAVQKLSEDQREQVLDAIM